MMRQYELVERVRAYDPSADEAALNKAYVFAMQAHGSQKRASGDPYFSHPLEVAGILTGLKLDTASIVTALLHDVVEDTDYTLHDIEALFGPEIRRLVDGVTKLSRIELQSDHTKQAENFRKLVIAMSEDIRVLLVKLADRLHNMRTLHYVGSEEKRRRVARETMDIFVPLAERIGLNSIKAELEDLAFAELNPDGRESVVARLNYLHDESGVSTVQAIIGELGRVLGEARIVCEVSGREKSPYSIWRKMQHKNVGFEQLSDIMAFRVVTHSVPDCYQVLGVIHSQYPVVPGRFKDYISTPKANGYQSIHTGVIGPQKQRIEMQIRTVQMHDQAERGVAAHWEYKQGGAVPDGRRYRWLQDFLEILEQAASPEDFLEHTKLEMFSDRVFCFTPKGDLIDLPRGSTPVDFAYAVHSEVGDHCTGAKINGRLMPLRTALANGDQVEITTNRAQTPSPTWERFVVTGKARARIRRFIRTQKREEYIDLGRTMLQRTFRQEGHALSDKLLARAFEHCHVETVDDLYAVVGEGLRTANEVLHAVFPDAAHPQKPRPQPGAPHEAEHRNDVVDKGVPIGGLIPGLALHFARCCHPLPGDRIRGIVTTGKGVTIHTEDCATLERFMDTPERFLDVYWTPNGDGHNPFVGRLHVVIDNRPGSLGTLTTIIAKNNGNITNLKITNRSIDFFDMLVDIEVKDTAHLNDVIADLRSNKAIGTVERQQG
ncbi:MAG: bifunctional (p)ppGpp synthetase/guanosine-3',5'-bis(diphosphate) 3'-pyrophosphohydrolase [Alphaproteobacteria bacterium]